VKNGKISGFEYLKTLKGKNNRIEETGSSSEDSIFNGQISIIQSFLFQSPFANGVFNDQLLDESSLFYVKALIEAISILTALLTPVLKSMGIDNFSILILGFSPGSIRINFELQIPSEDMSLSGNPGNIAILENLQAHITENNDFAVSLGSGANLALLDSSITSITGGDGDILTSNCPTCWKVSGGLCVPDENYIQINCSQANKIILKADNCVFENLDLSEMSLNGGCNADSGNIYENSGEIFAWTPLDGCTSSKQFSGDVVTFGNTLTGVHSGTWNDQYRIDFTCSYPVNPTVDHEYEVQSGLVSGPVTSFGNLGFDIDFYKNDEFSEIVGGPFRVGTNLYGKGTKQYLKMIENSQNSIVFETIDAFNEF